MNLNAYPLSKQNSLSKSISTRLFLLYIFSLGSLTLCAQDFGDIDSLLIDRNIENYSIRLFTNYRVNKFSLKNENSRVRYTPNDRHGIGFGIANRKLILDLAFNLKNLNKEKTRRFDLQITKIFKNRHYANIYVQSYRGFEAKNNFDEPSIFRSDIRSISVGFNYLYTLDNIEFSLALLKAGLANENDKDVFVTGGVGAFGIFDYFSSDSTILSETGTLFFNEEANIKRYQGVGVGLQAGLISYFKLPENITATVNIIPGIGIMTKKITLQDGNFRPSQPSIYKLDFSLGAAYNFNRFYLSLSYSNGLYTTSFDSGNDYRLNLSKAKLALGYKFGRRKKKQLKQSLF